MRIRRSLNSTTSSAAHTSSFDPDHNHNDVIFTTPTRCSTSNNNITNTKTGSIIICVFNQSPWDVNDLSSLQLDGGLFSLTGIAPVPKLAIGSQSFGFSVKLCVEETLRPAAASDKCLNRRGNSNVAGLSPPEVKIMAEKSSTRRKIISSNKPQFRTFSVKKQQVESSDDSAMKMGMKRRGRAAKNSAADPNEFYYYSGFGPHWGKKRETVTKSSVLANKIVVSDQELQIKTDGGTKRDIEFMDYDDDENDDNDIEIEENEGMRRPRGRKRVKARSLKSLM